MSDKDFIDRELELELRDSNSIFDWNPRMTTQQTPPETELIPVGEYDGVDIPGCYVLDNSYIVYMEVNQ